MMRRICLLIVLCACFTALLAGCSGVADSGAERYSRAKQINDLQMRMLVDDWDYFWLYDRNTYLTKYHPRVGH